MQINPQIEKWFPHIALAIAVLACAAIAPHDRDFFLGNFLYYVAPSAAAWFIGLIFRIRPAIAAGAVVSFMALIVLFYFFLKISGGGDSMAWLAPFLSLPGGVIAYMGVTVLAAKKLGHLSAFPAFFLSLVVVAIGLFINYLLLPLIL